MSEAGMRSNKDEPIKANEEEVRNLNDFYEKMYKELNFDNTRVENALWPNNA